MSYVWHDENDISWPRTYVTFIILTHLPVEKMAAISKTTFSDAFSRMKKNIPNGPIGITKHRFW